MNKLLLFILSLSFIFISFGCSSDKVDETVVQELEKLKNQIKEDSIFRDNWATETQKVDELLNQITGFTADAQAGLLEGPTLKEKAESIGVLMDEANETIAQLEHEAKKNKRKVKKIPNLIKNLKEQKEKVLEQNALILDLKNQVKEGKVQINRLSNTINLQGKTIEEKEAEINRKIAILQQKESELIEKQGELEATRRKSIADLKKQKNSFHVSVGIDQVQIIELAPGMAKKKKEEILKKAWEHFCVAHKGGYHNALTEMSKLQSHKNNVIRKFCQRQSCN
jgi:peptidoglycan hydrolase CwlO-like protein